MKIFLVDNGSLRPEATFSLRGLAAALSGRVGAAVHPVSLLHANRVDPAELGGEPALTFEPHLRALAEAGEREFGVLPLFFGPSRAFTEYIPQRVRVLHEAFPGLRVHVGDPLVRPGRADDLDAMGALLLDGIRAVLAEHPARGVVLVDHGTPVRAVSAVRDQLAAWLGERLAGMGLPVFPASMERRPGPEYAFNDPLLEHLLRAADRVPEKVVLSMLFLQPGRHAGPGGDVADIVADACRARGGLEVWTTQLVGEHPGLIAVLEERYRALLRAPAASIT